MRQSGSPWALNKHTLGFISKNSDTATKQLGMDLPYKSSITFRSLELVY